MQLNGVLAPDSIMEAAAPKAMPQNRKRQAAEAVADLERAMAYLDSCRAEQDAAMRTLETARHAVRRIAARLGGAAPENDNDKWQRDWTINDRDKSEP